MPFGHKAGLPPSKKYLLMRQPLFFHIFLAGGFDKEIQVWYTKAEILDIH